MELIRLGAKMKKGKHVVQNYNFKVTEVNEKIPTE